MMMKAVVSVAAFLFVFSAAAARPVARWDTVPYQFATGVLDVGVAAFHEKGVSVEFFVNGEKKFTAGERVRNRQSGIREFVFPFDASEYPDGPVEITAKALTPGEDPCELGKIVIYANSGKSLGTRKVVWADYANGNDFSPGTKSEPVRTLKRAVQKCGDGGVVLLKPGVYPSRMIGGGLSRRYWTMVMAAPGSKPGSVKLRPGRTGTDKLLFRNVVFECDVLDGYGTAVLGEDGSTSAWFDNCVFRNAHGRYAGETTPFGGRLTAYVTGGVTEDMTDGPGAVLIRSHKVRRIARNAFTPPESGALVCDCTVEDLAPPDKVHEACLVKASGAGDGFVENLIVWSVKASKLRSHVFFGARWRDSAVVGLHAEPDEAPLVVTQFAGDMENVVFADVSTGSQTWQWVSPKNKTNMFRPKAVRLFSVKTAGMSGYDAPAEGDGALLISETVPRDMFPGT